MPVIVIEYRSDNGDISSVDFEVSAVSEAAPIVQAAFAILADNVASKAEA